MPAGLVATLQAPSTARVEGVTGIEPLVSAEEVAALLNVQPAWVLEQARAGELPSYKLGHYRRFRLSEVEEWLSIRASGIYKRRNVLGDHQASG